MLLDKAIGFDPITNEPFIDGNDFARELLHLDTLGKKKIQIWINSSGGNVAEGMAIYNAILKTKTNVDTYCVGIAASIAAVIFQAGRTRTMSDYGQLMYHNPSGGENSVLKSIKASIVTMISARSGKTEDEVSKIMDKETWVNANAAKEGGLCDKIEFSGEHNKPRKVNEAEMYWADSNKILNKILNQNNMKNIAKSLGLAENATELEITNAIECLKKPATPAKEAEEAENGKAVVNSISVAVAEALKAPLAEITALKNKIEGEEAKAKTFAAKELINKHLDKIGGKTATAEIVNQWENDAILDFDATFKKLEALPVNKAAVKIENKNNPNEGEALPTNAMSYMAKVNVENKKNGYQVKF